MLKGCLIGDPVSQSIAHITHNAVFRHLHLPCEYTKKNITKDDLAKEIPKLKEENLLWLGVTMPLKQAIVPHLDYLKESAHTLKAVNTIVVKDGKWIGEMCDGQGCLNAIEKKIPVHGLKVLVAGAGGTAKAIAHEAKKRGARVFVWNRTQIRAESVCIDLKLECLYELKGEYDIVINATSVGMNSCELSLPVTILKRARLVLDVVYSPLETALLTAAKTIGCEIVTGLDMFLELSAIQIQWALHTSLSNNQLIEVMRKSVSESFLNKF